MIKANGDGSEKSCPSLFRFFLILDFPPTMSCGQNRYRQEWAKVNKSATKRSTILDPFAISDGEYVYTYACMSVRVDGKTETNVHTAPWRI